MWCRYAPVTAANPRDFGNISCFLSTPRKFQVPRDGRPTTFFKYLVRPPDKCVATDQTIDKVRRLWAAEPLTKYSVRLTNLMDFLIHFLLDVLFLLLGGVETRGLPRTAVDGLVEEAISSTPKVSLTPKVRGV